MWKDILFTEIFEVQILIYWNSRTLYGVLVKTGNCIWFLFKSSSKKTAEDSESGLGK